MEKYGLLRIMYGRPLVIRLLELMKHFPVFLVRTFQKYQCMGIMMLLLKQDLPLGINPILLHQVSAL
jgi:hypothetical protein